VEQVIDISSAIQGLCTFTVRWSSLLIESRVRGRERGSCTGVDVILTAAAKLSDVNNIKHHTLSDVLGRDLGESRFFLQISTESDRQHQLLAPRQQNHVDKLVQASWLGEAHPESMPIITDLLLDPHGEVFTDLAVITNTSPWLALCSAWVITLGVESGYESTQEYTIYVT
jgi:hypothetical protein